MVSIAVSEIVLLERQEDHHSCLYMFVPMRRGVGGLEEFQLSRKCRRT